MSRIIYVPQYPAPLRYQEWHYHEFPKNYSKYFDEVIVLGKEYLDKRTKEQKKYQEEFSNLGESINLDFVQAKEFLSLKLRKDDVLFLTDISYPGYFINTLFHKRPKKCFVFCHATAKNKYDYFQPVRKVKYSIEKSLANLFDTVFVASDYHYKKLGWPNIQVVGLPDSPYSGYFINPKTDPVCSVARLCKQKVSIKMEKRLQRELKFKIVRSSDWNVNTWDTYYMFLACSKILLISSKEDTFGYSVLDAIKNDCVPLAPRNFSYKEMLPDFYLYSNYQELKCKVNEILKYDVYCPKLNNQRLIDNFYETTSEIMLGK